MKVNEINTGSYWMSEYMNMRQERIAEVKEDVHHPPEKESVTRTLHQHGFNYNDLTDVEKVGLFV